MRHIRLYVLIVLVGVSFVSGCCIPPHAVWLRDSSGFLYTAPAERYHNLDVDVFHFDLSAQKTRRVLSQTQTATRLPAISPDGKQFALIRATATATSVWRTFFG